MKITRSKNLKPARDAFRRMFPNAEDLSESSLVWYLRDGDVIAGWGTALVVQDMLYLNSAGVFDNYRGHGYHRRLIRARVSYARYHNLHCITYTSFSNWRSINNLIRCGFTTYRPEWLWAGKEFVYWRLR